MGWPTVKSGVKDIVAFLSSLGYMQGAPMRSALAGVQGEVQGSLLAQEPRSVGQWAPCCQGDRSRMKEGLEQEVCPKCEKSVFDAEGFPAGTNPSSQNLVQIFEF